jgi:regulator of RNase E activity RraA
MKPDTREKLKSVSVATLTTALFKRGFRVQCIQDVHPLNPNAGNMVGEAFTLRYIPAREDLNPITVFQDRSHPQRKAIEECPPGAVFVIDSRKDPRAASAGGILVSRLMKRGAAGIVTDGGFSRFTGDREAAVSGLSQPSLRADEPHHPSRDRRQRADRVRRRPGVSG